MYKNNVVARLRPCPNNRGITLIALVITIIVMLILVGVTISMSINGGLFDYAGKAVGETQNAVDAEQQLADGKIKVDRKWYASIDDYLEGKVMVELPEGIKVGDYVNYTPTEGTYKVADESTGYTTTDGYQSFSTEDLDWRILSIDEETGEIEIVAATQTSSVLYLQGFNGYNHAVDILNDLCEELYSNEKGAIARSIKVEDINEKTTYDYTTDTKYGTVYTPDDKNYPNIYAKELGSTVAGLNGTGLTGSEGVEKGTKNGEGVTEYTTYTGSSRAETLNATYTKYSYVPESYLADLGINTAPAGLLNTGTYYYLASRCVDANSYSAYFCVYYISFNGKLCSYILCRSNGYWRRTWLRGSPSGFSWVECLIDKRHNELNRKFNILECRILMLRNYCLQAGVLYKLAIKKI